MISIGGIIRYLYSTGSPAGAEWVVTATGAVLGVYGGRGDFCSTHSVHSNRSVWAQSQQRERTAKHHRAPLGRSLRRDLLAVDAHSRRRRAGRLSKCGQAEGQILRWRRAVSRQSVRDTGWVHVRRRSKRTSRHGRFGLHRRELGHRAIGSRRDHTEHADDAHAVASILLQPARCSRTERLLGTSRHAALSRRRCG